MDFSTITKLEKSAPCHSYKKDSTKNFAQITKSAEDQLFDMGFAEHLS